MTAFDLDRQHRWLFCMTHPDDEISICAWIRRLTRNGSDVFISWTHSTPVREAEARSIAERLGVPGDRLSFFGGTDGSVCHELDRLRPRFEQLMAEVRPTRVVCGAFEQGHLDHDSTNWLVNQTFSGPVLEVPFYHAYLGRYQTLNRFSDPRGQMVCPLDLDDQKFKCEVARGYPSQNIWPILLAYEATRMLSLRPVELAKSERMRWQTHRDFGSPNHPPRLAELILKSPKWAQWRKALAQASGVEKRSAAKVDVC